MQDGQPAATDAERAVIHAEQQARAARAQAAPMAGDASGIVETSIREAAELIDAGDRDDRGADQPAMRQHDDTDVLDESATKHRPVVARDQCIMDRMALDHPVHHGARIIAPMWTG